MEKYNPSNEPYYEYFINNDYNFLASGYMHCVFEKNDKIYKIQKSKFNNFNHLKNYQNEIESMKILKENDIPVPIIYDLKQEKINEKNYYVLVEEKMDGILKDYNEMSEKEKIEIYNMLTKVSRIKLPCYGPLTLTKDNKFSSWKAYMDVLCNIAYDTVKKYRIKINIEKVIKEINNQMLDDIKPNFLILDPNVKNLIFDEEGKIICLIDIDHPLGGDVLYQLASYKYFLKDFYIFLIKKGYINNEEAKIVSLYTIIFSINDLYFRVNAEDEKNVNVNKYIEKIIDEYNEMYKGE